MVRWEVKGDGKHYVFTNYIYRLKSPNFFSFVFFHRNICIENMGTLMHALSNIIMEFNVSETGG